MPLMEGNLCHLAGIYPDVLLLTPYRSCFSLWQADWGKQRD